MHKFNWIYDFLTLLNQALEANYGTKCNHLWFQMDQHIPV